MTIEEMNQVKKEKGYSYKDIAQLSGLPVSTVQKVLGGITKSPRHDTLKALEEALAPEKTPGSAPAVEEKLKNGLSRSAIEDWISLSLDLLDTFEDDEEEDDEMKAVISADRFNENTAYKANGPDDLPGIKKKKQGEYTLEDYYTLPDERRVELIDGVIYDMAAPTNIHQLVTGRIFFAFSILIGNNKGRCIPFVSPVNVQLDMDDRTMVQPDVIVLCDRKKNLKRNIYGAPDLLVEVLSPSSAKRDMSLKFKKYKDAGVREYWIVDPEDERIIAYRFEEEIRTTIYGRNSKVPVGIFGGECSIDFGEIFDYIDSLFEYEDEEEEEV